MSVATRIEIAPEDDDFGCVLDCAVRYALGRRTYMPYIVISFIKPLLSALNDKTLWCFERDLEDCTDYGDPNVDEPMWLRFMSDVKTEIQRRKNHE